jgi:hypothetical protein
VIRRNQGIRPRMLMLAALMLLATSMAFAASAQAASPAWKLLALTGPTNLPPLGEGTLLAYPTNVGGAATTTATTSVTVGPLPEGIRTAASAKGKGWTCPPTGAGQEIVTCTRNDSAPALSAVQPVEVPLQVGPTAAPASIAPVTMQGGGAALSSSFEAEITVSAARAKPGVQAFWAGAFDADGVPSTQAGGHPHSAATMFLVNTNLNGSNNVVPAGEPRDVIVDLPPGFVGNPMVTERCPRNVSGTCLLDAHVGEAKPMTTQFPAEITGTLSRVYNDVPPIGYAAEFNFGFVEAHAAALASVRSDEDFGVTVTAPNLTPSYKVFGSYFLLEGNPADAHGKAFLTNPTDCANEAVIPPITTIMANSWEQPTLFGSRMVDIPPVLQCGGLQFKPTFSFQPSSTAPASPTGATAHLHVDQAGLTDPAKLAPPHLKDSIVTLPEGLNLNPSAADGLQACTTAQIGFKGNGYPMPNPTRFTKASPTCPDASKVGTAQIDSPLLEDPLAGTVYLAAQGDNPFNSLLALYILIDDEETGIVAKLPGKVTPDPKTGQLTASFENNPQVPFEDLTLNFRGGPRSTLATPDICAAYTTSGSWTPWSAPESGAASPTTDSFSVAGGATCPTTKAERPFNLGLSAGTTNPIAGSHSPFTLQITRPDGNQELDKISVTVPPGLLASLKGVGICSEAQIAQALSRNQGGDGAKEIASPSCSSSSQIGTTTIGAGVGSSPIYVKTGKVYLSGPYKSAPISLTFVVPAVAGPFDLGVQVVRTALNIDPKTAQATAVSDSIPQILDGIPLQIRDVRVNLDRQGFMLNPTNCEAMSIAGTVTGGSGAIANLTDRFQVDGCRNLGFKPKLKIQLHGKTKRASYQRLEAVVTAREGDANIAKASVALPHSEFLAQEHIRTVCTRVQFAADACPKGSIYGHAEAVSPLLDGTISGPVYLRSSNNPLPDLVAALRGPDAQPIKVELAGRTDSVNGGIRNTFDIVPDAPVSKFTLRMFGGDKSLIVNSRDLCKGKAQKATAKFTAQNGKTHDFRPVVGNDCGKHTKGKRK